MAYDISLEIGDGNCPAGTRNNARLQILETSTRTNAGGFRIDLKANATGRFIMLRTPEPWIGYCNYILSCRNAAGEFEHMTSTWRFRDLQIDKNIQKNLVARPEPLVMADTMPADPGVLIPGWPPTDPGVEPVPPPTKIPTERIDGLLGVFTVNGVPQAGEPWFATSVTGSESGVTNSLGEIRLVSVTGAVTLTIDNATISELVGNEFVTIDRS